MSGAAFGVTGPSRPAGAVGDSDLTGYELVCELTELALGRPARAEVGGIPMAIVRVRDTEVHAVHDLCTHGNVSLSEGEVDECTLECWLHGSRFDLRTGVPCGPPATVPIAVYPVRLLDGAVHVRPTPIKES